jgi:hypothetical protein
MAALALWGDCVGSDKACMGQTAVTFSPLDYKRLKLINTAIVAIIGIEIKRFAVESHQYLLHYFPLSTGILEKILQNCHRE